MSSRRLVRVAEVIRAELSRLIARERLVEDAIVTITSIEVTPDLKHAFIYVSALNDLIPPNEIVASLSTRRLDWQKEIGKKMSTKFTPRLSFRYDDAQQRGDRVMQILNGIEPPPELPPLPSENKE